MASAGVRSPGPEQLVSGCSPAKVKTTGQNPWSLAECMIAATAVARLGVQRQYTPQQAPLAPMEDTPSLGLQKLCEEQIAA